MLTTLENCVVTAAKGWETTVMDAARSLFWILAGIEIGIAAVWLALQAASLDSWFAELVRRIMFIGLFAFILDQGRPSPRPSSTAFSRSAPMAARPRPPIFSMPAYGSPRNVRTGEFGLFEDNALAIAAVFAMVVVVVASRLSPRSSSPSWSRCMSACLPA